MRGRGSQFRVRFAVDGDGKIVSTFEAVHAGATKAKGPVEGLARELVELSDRVNQGAAATRQYAQDQAVLDAALQRGLVTAREHSRLMNKAWQQTPDAQQWLDFGRSIGRGMLWAGGAVAAATALVVRNTVQWENQLAQLEAVHQSTGNAIGMTRQELVGLAEELSRASTFGRNEIVEAETRLLSYSGIVGTNFPRAMQAVIDQSARLGLSVAQSAEVIGRALESPAKAAAALSDQGFGAAFTDEVRATIDALVEAGREAEAQIMILEILEESYGGAAQAARDTFGGALGALKNSLGDLMTGREGSLEGATTAVNELIDSLNDPQVQAGFDSIVTNAIKAASALAKLAAEISHFPQLGSALEDQSDSFLRKQIEGFQREIDAVENGLTFRLREKLGLSSQPVIDALREQMAPLEAELQRRLVARGVDAGLGSAPGARPTPRPIAAPPPAGARSVGTTSTITEEDRALAQLERRMESYLGRLSQANELEQARIENGGRTTEAARAEFEIRATGLDALNPALAEAIRLEAALRDEQVESNRLRTAAERVINANRTALERLAAELAEYDEQLAANALTQEQHAAAVARAQGAFDEQQERIRQANRSMTRAMLEDWMDLGKGMDYAMARSADSISDHLHAMVMRGETDVGRLADTIISEFTRVLMDRAVAGVLDAFGQGLQGAGGFWGALGNILSGSRATGGGVRGGGVYEITEHGRPEVLRQGNDAYLIPGADGTVYPLQTLPGTGAAGGGGGGLEFHQHFAFTTTGVGGGDAGNAAAAQREFAEQMRAMAQAEIARAMRPGGPLWRAGVRHQ